MGERDDGVGRPVAVVAGVEFAAGAEDGEVEAGGAADAEDDLLAAALVDGSVTEDPEVGVEFGFVRGEDGGDVGGACFFFAIEEELDVGAERLAGVGEGVERGEEGDDGGFVVAGGTGVDAVFGLERGGGGDGLAGGVADLRLEGRSEPLRGIDGLAVVVGVEHDGAGGAGCADFAEDGGDGSGGGERLGGDAAFAHHGDDVGGVAIHVGAVSRDVGQGEEGEEFVDDWALVGLTPLAGEAAARVAGGIREGVR